MDAGRWGQIEAIFHEARKLQGAARAEFVRTACGADRELCDEVLTLLTSAETAGDFMAAGPSLSAEPESRPAAGERMGAYRIDREIGEGGMGAVYLASRADQEFEKQVAIKVVRSGVHGRLLAGHFRRERQILAGLEHPNIVRLLDGGLTADGQPYLVMEYVEGEPIESYCSAAALPVAERLHLFRKVCGAVHYAHRHLVIHRDLKPSNILVTAEGDPKLLDFGIAKLTGEGEARELPAATPEFASPELLARKPVTTAADVYSLGVILKRLLPAEMPRDLASIVRKALDAEPEQRYASAELLSEDIRRHLESLPVLAGNEPVRDLAAKFVRRHRAGALAAALAIASMVTATVVSVYHARVAAREREVAERRLRELERVTSSVLFEFHDAIQMLPGATQARKLLVTRALEHLKSLDVAAARQASERAQLAEAYRKIGDVQGNPTNANLGDTAGALASYARALEIARGLVREDAGNAAYRRSLALLLQRTADTEAQAGQVKKAVEDSRASLAMFTELARADGGLESQQQAGTANIKLADLLGHPAFPNVGDHAGAMEHYREGLRIYSGLQPADDPVNRRYLGILYERLGKMAEVERRPDEALANYDKSFRIREALSVRYPANTNARRDLAIAHEKIGDLLFAAGKAAQALARFQEALRIFEALHTLDPGNANATRALAIEYEKLADVYAAMGRGAREFRERALGIYRGMAAADPLNARVREDVGRLERVTASFHHDLRVR